MISDLRFRKNIAGILLSLSIMVLMSAGCNQKKQNPRAQPIVQQQQIIQVRQKVEGGKEAKTYTVIPSEKKTALDLLKIDHKIETKNFSGIGEFVESINGVKPDHKHFWAFYINGKSSNVGAGSYKPVDKDYVEWKLEKISNSSN